MSELKYTGHVTDAGEIKLPRRLCCGAKQKIWNIIDNWYLLNGKEYCPLCYRKLKNQNV